MFVFGIVLFAVILFWFVAAYNGIIGIRNQTQNALKQIDVQLKRRHDLVPNLIQEQFPSSIGAGFAHAAPAQLWEITDARGAPARSSWSSCLSG